MINSFSGQHRWLSNFWPAEVEYSGVMYPTVEHAYVAAKTINPIQRLMVSECKTPGKAKRLGRDFDLRPQWDTLKYGIMEYLINQKFSTPELRERLVATGDQPIIEGNTWGDTYWGVCEGQGQNNLGKIIMNVRKSLTYQNRVGILRVSKCVLHKYEDMWGLDEVFDEIGFEYNSEVYDESTGVVRYRGQCPEFQEIQQGELLPEYEIVTVIDTQSGQVQHNVERS